MPPQSQPPYGGGPMPPYPPQGPSQIPQPPLPGQLQAPQPGPYAPQPPYPQQPGPQQFGPPQPGQYPGQQAQQYSGPPAPTQSYQPHSPVTPYAPPASLNQRGPDPVPPPPPRPESPYDFFMSSQPTKRQKTISLPGAGNKNAKIMYIAGGGTALLLILIIAALLAPKTPEKLALVTVAQAQSETMRLCDDGYRNGKLQQTKSFAMSCSLSMLTDQRELAAYLNKAGAKADPKTLALGRNTKADKELATAKSSSTYDDTFRTVIKAQFTVLNRSIKQAAAAPDTTATERKQLSKYDEAAQLLLKQLDQ